jgi:teichuronic acid biosynthesis glycosyltransferase TuaG
MISILMPIYNGVEFFKQSLLSIIYQTYTKWELLIGINGHPENSEVYKEVYRIVESFLLINPSLIDKIRIFDLYYIHGKSNTLNNLLPLCKYNYIALLDVDDIWLKNKLEIQSSFIDKYDIIGTHCIYFGDIQGIKPAIPLGDLTNFDFKKVNPIINSSVIIRKNLCNWDYTKDGVEDYDLWLKLKKENKTFYNCHDVLVWHRIHNSSAFNSKGNHLKVNELLNTY